MRVSLSQLAPFGSFATERPQEWLEALLSRRFGPLCALLARSLGAKGPCTQLYTIVDSCIQSAQSTQLYTLARSSPVLSPPSWRLVSGG